MESAGAKVAYFIAFVANNSPGVCNLCGDLKD
jgi:hypothetical protein